MGIRTNTSLNARQDFQGDAGGSELALRIPVGLYEKAHRPFVDNLQPEATHVLWDSLEASGVVDEYDFGILCNYGTIDLHLAVFVAGGQPEQLVGVFKVRAGGDYNIDGEWYGADNAGEVGAPTFHTPILKRVSKLTVWNPSNTDVGSCELFMFAEAE